MSKLTNAEKDKLDNTCGNLRVTKLGTHVKTLEDFVNEGVLDTRANTVVEAINELYGMIVNKDCEGITIPPPGFFTLFGNDEDGKLYVYYNNADYPPQFRHVETPGELEGTLYLYIADPLGENHYELEVGHYIAVRHLDNYYTKAQINSMFTVTVEKQTTAESGSFATYVVKQGGTQVGAKINIPKDYLVKSCSVKTCTTANVPVQGYKVGDKYIDWVINTRDGSATNEHLYLLVNEIVEPYKADNSTVTLSSGNVFSVKDGGITLVKLAPAVQNLINGKADANHAHGNITKEGKVGTTQNVPLITGTDGVVQAGSFGSGANNFARGNHEHSDLASIAYVDNQIASVEGDVVIDLESKADRDHTHGLDEIGYKTIGANADFESDAYKEQGFYHINYNNAQSATNMPFKTGGLLIVRELGDGISQTFQRYNAPEMWYKTYYRGGNQWSDWKKISLDGHTHTKSQISDFSHTHGLDEVSYKTIGANADFESDTYKEQGFYHINHNNAQSSTNMPFKTGGLLIVRELGDGISQTFQRYYSSEMWYKTYYRGGNQWSDWKKISLDGHTHGLDEVSYKTIGANADFESDTYKEQGFYHINYNNAQSSTNMPFKTGGLLIVRELGDGISQTFQRYNGTDMWYKTYYYGSWSDWKKISLEGHTHTTSQITNFPTSMTPTSHTHQLNDVGLTKIGANADFETYKQQGFYYINYDDAQSSTNMPFKTGGLLIVRNLVGGVSQTFQRYNGTEMWYKTYPNGGQWSGWKKICFADHTHGNIQSGGTIGSDANKPLITTTSGKITTGSFGTGANSFCQGNDSRITNAVKSACKIGFSTSSSAPGDAMNLSVAQGNPLYAFVRDANGNVPTGLAGGAFLFNGSPRSVTINSNGIMSLTMNTAGTFVIHAIVSDGDGYQVAAGFCRITVS